MKMIRLMAVLCTITFLAVPINTGARNSETIPRVVGYLPDWHYKAYKDIDFSALTNINIAFCNPDSKGNLSCDIPDDDLCKIVSIAHENDADVFAALSPQRQLTFMLEMSKCVKNDSQFIIVTHSPILLGYPDADILSFDDGEIQPISYEDTQSYQITKMFINDRKQILRHLFEE